MSIKWIVDQNLNSIANKVHGEEPPIVHISAFKGDRDWTFAIRDNDIGLDVTYLDRIFQMFQRLQTKEKYPGTGIGLAIAKKIVELHGGGSGSSQRKAKGPLSSLRSNEMII